MVRKPKPNWQGNPVGQSTKTGILYQCKHCMKTKPRKGYYFRFKEEYDRDGFVL